VTQGQALAAFTLAAGLLTVTPGLDTALVLRTAAVEGSRRALFVGAGICLGCLTWGLAASAGLGELLAASRLAYDALRLAGACYLGVLGARLLFHTHASMPSFAAIAPSPHGAASAGESPFHPFARGLLTNLLNPKVAVFYVTFLPQFVPAGVRVAPFSMLLAAIHVAEGMLWFLALTIATRPLSRWLQSPGVAANTDRIAGTVLIGFGLALAIERRR